MSSLHSANSGCCVPTSVEILQPEVSAVERCVARNGDIQEWVVARRLRSNSTKIRTDTDSPRAIHEQISIEERQQ